MPPKKDKASSRERRVYIRTDSSVSVALHIKNKTGIEELQGVTKNISATGIMVETDKDLPLSSDIKIDLSPPHSTNPIHCSGKVIWSTPLQKAGVYQCGIAFTNIEEDNKNTFLKFLCDAIYKVSGRPV
jgi:c-di-GMP-binding flagellar brake protein YcgR